MKLIHGRGFKLDEKRRLIPFIYEQIIHVVRCICRAMQNLRIRFEKARNEVRRVPLLEPRICRKRNRWIESDIGIRSFVDVRE